MNYVPGLKGAIQKAKLTQSEFAEKMGVTTVTISRWVRGEIEPSISNVYKIADVLNSSVVEILGLSLEKQSGCTMLVTESEAKRIITIEIDNR
ncbi:MAG: helix-turn-helix transcriptional regulator [Synergistaceae bacterium]